MARTWVPPITGFFEAGHCQVLVGTRGLLGEGWDARRVTGLVDLTTATTLTAVVQTRGRALRADPGWGEKVAVNWTVVCVSDGHPKGANDWARLVRKHEGFLGVDADGDIVDGVSHIDAAFSPYAPPPTGEFDAINARMLARADAREEVRARWRVGEPYRDTVAATLRVRPAAPVPPLRQPGAVARLVPQPASVALGEHGVEVRDPLLQPPETRSWRDTGSGVVAAVGGLGAVAVPAAGSGLGALGLGLAGAGVAVAGAGLVALHGLRRSRSEVLRRWVVGEVTRAAAVPSVGQVAAAVAEALADAGVTRAGAEAVVVEVHPDGEHRCRLDGAGAEAAAFAEALDDALAPLAAPRYVVSRFTVAGVPALGEGVRLHGRRTAMAALRGYRAPDAAWHAVPEVLGTKAARARAYQRAWTRWVGPGRLLYTGSPEGAGVLAAQQGVDPFAATTVVRRHWL